MFSNNINHDIYNLGNSKPITLNSFIETCEKVCGNKANVINKSMPLGDVPHTFANINRAREDLNYDPKTSLEDGLKQMYNWMINDNI